jgi:ubiquitin-conjugating enzyme E2 S
MTSIHAQVPKDLKGAVMQAKRRGEDAGTVIREYEEEKRITVRKTVESSVVMKKPQPSPSGSSSRQQAVPPPLNTQPRHQADQENYSDESDTEENPSKENDPSLSPSPVSPAPPTVRKNILGKRPLSALPTPTDPDDSLYASGDDDALSANERNIAANASAYPSRDQGNGPRKSPKLAERLKGVNASGRIRDDLNTGSSVVMPFADETAQVVAPAVVSQPLKQLESKGKENVTEASGSATHVLAVQGAGVKKMVLIPGQLGRMEKSGRTASGASTTSTASSKSGKAKAGLRRL